MSTEKPSITYSAEPSDTSTYIKQLYQYRSLIWLFAYQEIKSIYAQTYLGLLWALIRPLFTILVFTIIFKFFLHVPTQSPYYLFAFTGMIAWNLFSHIAINGSTAIIQKQNLIRKMYFPKLIPVLSKVIVGLTEAAISFTLLLVFLLLEKQTIGISIIALPVFIFYNVVCGLGVAVWMNALNIRFRDLNQIIPSLIGVAIWVTPVFYPTTIIPAQFDFLLFANPMAGVIKGVRYAIINEPVPEWQYLVAFMITTTTTIVGIWYLSKVESDIVDYA